MVVAPEFIRCPQGEASPRTRRKKKTPAGSTRCNSSDEGLCPKTHEGERTMSIIQHEDPAGNPDGTTDVPIPTDLLAPALADLVERSEQTTLVQHDQPAPGASQTPPPWSTIGIAIATGDWRGGEVTMPVSADPEYLWWESPDILIPFEFPGNNALSTDEGVYLPHYRTYAIQGAYAGPSSARIVVEHIRPRTTGDQRPTTQIASGRPATMRRLGEALIAVARAVEGGDDW